MHILFFSFFLPCAVTQVYTSATLAFTFFPFNPKLCNLQTSVHVRFFPVLFFFQSRSSYGSSIYVTAFPPSYLTSLHLLFFPFYPSLGVKVALDCLFSSLFQIPFFPFCILVLAFSRGLSLSFFNVFTFSLFDFIPPQSPSRVVFIVSQARSW